MTDPVEHGHDVLVGGIREIPAPGFRKVDCGFPAVSQDSDADEANAQTRQKGGRKKQGGRKGAWGQCAWFS